MTTYWNWLTRYVSVGRVKLWFSNVAAHQNHQGSFSESWNPGYTAYYIIIARAQASGFFKAPLFKQVPCAVKPDWLPVELLGFQPQFDHGLGISLTEQAAYWCWNYLQEFSAMSLLQYCLGSFVFVVFNPNVQYGPQTNFIRISADGTLPGHRYFSKLPTGNQVQINAVKVGETPVHSNMEKE